MVRAAERLVPGAAEATAAALKRKHQPVRGVRHAVCSKHPAPLWRRLAPSCTYISYACPMMSVPKQFPFSEVLCALFPIAKGGVCVQAAYLPLCPKS